MNITMYNCGFGDCFRLEDEGMRDLYVDFGIHTSSMSNEKREARFIEIINDMGDEKDFLLTHYHEDHYNGAVFMGNNYSGIHSFHNIYIPNIWGFHKGVYPISLLLLNDVLKKNTLSRKTTLIEFLQKICTDDSLIHFVSRGTKFHDNRYVALWPDTNFIDTSAKKYLVKYIMNCAERYWRRRKPLPIYMLRNT